MGSCQAMENSMMKSSTLLKCGPLPSYFKSTSCPPDIAHVVSVPKPSLFFTTLPCTSLCYTDHKLKSKTRETWEWRYTSHDHKQVYKSTHVLHPTCLPMRMVGTFLGGSTFVMQVCMLLLILSIILHCVLFLVYADIQWSAQGGKFWWSQHRGLPLCNKQIPWLFHVWSFAVQPYSQMCIASSTISRWSQVLLFWFDQKAFLLW